MSIYPSRRLTEGKGDMFFKKVKAESILPEGFELKISNSEDESEKSEKLPLVSKGVGSRKIKLKLMP